ncbi:MAG: nickel-dependent hydrogenase large subunit [Acetobacteraceae bacterium]|nr:nickel-dependent hydrogenase large subunit [Acetobacteraceae bacterium]
MAAALSQDSALRLVGLWADVAQVHCLFADDAARVVLPASTAVQDGKYGALSPARPGAAWFERMLYDLWGHAAEGARDLRPWLDHGSWGHRRPMALRTAPIGPQPEPPSFLGSEGEDLHQVPVGPIHAGTIEPGHFRFTAHGETVVRLETRLGYAHKGTLGLMRGKPPRVAARFAARLSGDSTVAHSIAYSRAVEAALETEAPARAHALRAVMAELERIANHLGDIGAICNDAAFAFMLARCAWHREAVLRACARAFGHRLMMDCVIPGGIVAEMPPGSPEAIRDALAGVEAELPELLRIYQDTASLTDRVTGAGILDPHLAKLFGAGGFIGRAAGAEVDARRSPGYPPYADPHVPVLQDGDVNARVRIRFSEITESIRLVRQLLDDLPEGGISAPIVPGSGEGIGVAETFRGDAWVWVRIEGGMITAAFMRDPSWAHWPLLESAIRGNIIADFPLINKSFNAAYSGVDL